MTDAKEDVVRLQGVSWIDAVRRALSLPIRTFNTAVIYYHKFRLLHADNEYNWADASAAALFTACKIEDTLKKSREILCASWNLKVGPGEALSSDDPRFDIHSKQIIGLERLMLESAGFDFRNRYPQKLMVKLARALKFGQDNEGKTAWNLSVDLYRTFAPLKQNTPTLAIACLELAARLHGRDAEALVDRGACRYAKWGTSRGEVMGTSKTSSSSSLRGLNMLTRSRDPSRPPGPLHAQPFRYLDRPSVPTRNIHQHPHHPQHRSLAPFPSALHPLRVRDAIYNHLTCYTCSCEWAESPQRRRYNEPEYTCHTRHYLA